MTPLPHQPAHVDLDLTVTDDCWGSSGPVEDPEARLRTMVHINGVAHHLEACRVAVDADGSPLDPQQLAVFPEDLDALSSIYLGDGPFQTVTIHGAEYILVLYPHC